MWSVLDMPLYSVAEAARLVGLTSHRVSRWLRGYDYRYVPSGSDTEMRHQQPVVRRVGTAGTTYASFLDLIDLLFVRQFVDQGFSLQRVRKALDEATQILHVDHFACQRFFTDGSNIYLEIRDEGDALLQLLSGGQWVIAPIIRELADQIEFRAPDGLAERWYPFGSRGLVILDPAVAFGRPSVVGTGIPTSSIYDLFIAEREKMQRVCEWMSITAAQVEAAVAFERKLAA